MKQTKGEIVLMGGFFLFCSGFILGAEIIMKHGLIMSLFLPILLLLVGSRLLWRLYTWK